jgi:F0F1-type ATP synthase membrane subunit b/b'
MSRENGEMGERKTLKQAINLATVSLRGAATFLRGFGVRVTSVALASGVCGAAPAFAGAPHGEGHHPSVLEQLTWPSVNFVLYVLLIRYLYKRLGAPALKSRSIEIEQHLNRSAAELLAIEAELSQVNERIVRFEGERQVVQQDFEQEGVRLAAAAREAAQAEALRVQRDAQNQIRNSVRALEKELRRDLVLAATERARKRLQAGVSPERERALRSGVLRAIS